MQWKFGDVLDILKYNHEYFNFLLIEEFKLWGNQKKSRNNFSISDTNNTSERNHKAWESFGQGISLTPNLPVLLVYTFYDNYMQTRQVTTFIKPANLHDVICAKGSKNNEQQTAW